jgi:hypothetical protein
MAAKCASRSALAEPAEEAEEEERVVVDGTSSVVMTAVAATGISGDVTETVDVTEATTAAMEDETSDVAETVTTIAEEAATSSAVMTADPAVEMIEALFVVEEEEAVTSTDRETTTAAGRENARDRDVIDLKCLRRPRL